MRKTIIALLALLVAAMAMMPAVSAGDSGTAAGIVDKDVQAIFDSAKKTEALPSSLSPETKNAYFEKYTSPAREAIDLMKSNNYSNGQITAMLEKNGYGWNPSTAACWKGRDPTPEEQETIDKIRGPEYSPFPESSDISVTSSGSVKALRQQNSLMSLDDTSTYFGIYYEMKPGDMVISSSGTAWHVVTAHVGKKKPGGLDDWTEAGVVRSIDNTTKQFFTYDNDEGGWDYHGTASSSTYKPYEIYVTSTYESGGYLYHIWIDGSWVRDGHLYYRQTQYNCANEIWADGTDPFSQDTITSVFRNEYLYKSTGYQYWGDYPATVTSFSYDDPPYEIHSMNGNAWEYITWA